MSKKTFMPRDSGFNRIYPFPQFISKKVATLILTFILVGAAFIFLIDVFKQL